MLKLDETIRTREQRVGDYLDRLIKGDLVPGVQYMVVNRSRVIYEYYGGMQDIREKKPVTQQTTFMLNSITKVFTAGAILQLVERDAVHLEARLGTYFPDHPYGQDVSIRHLLNQTSGIPNPMPIKWFHLDEEDPLFDEDRALAEVMRGSRLKFPPGNKYIYSNISYWLLAKVVEQASGLSFPEYVRRNIFKPLSIRAAEMDFVIPDLRNQAREYRRKEFSMMNMLISFLESNRFRDATLGNWKSYKLVHHDGYGYGGLYGRAPALRKFLQEMLKELPVIFKKETRDAYFAPQKNNGGQLTGTTLGWHTGQVRGNEYFGKPGGGMGSHGCIRVYPGKNMATIYLANKMEVRERVINGFIDYLDTEFLE